MAQAQMLVQSGDAPVYNQRIRAKGLCEHKISR
jgi:hypothetical protein